MWVRRREGSRARPGHVGILPSSSKSGRRSRTPRAVFRWASRWWTRIALGAPIDKRRASSVWRLRLQGVYRADVYRCAAPLLPGQSGRRGSSCRVSPVRAVGGARHLAVAMPFWPPRIGGPRETRIVACRPRPRELEIRPGSLIPGTLQGLKSARVLREMRHTR